MAGRYESLADQSGPGTGIELVVDGEMISGLDGDLQGLAFDTGEPSGA